MWRRKIGKKEIKESENNKNDEENDEYQDVLVIEADAEEMAKWDRQRNGEGSRDKWCEDENEEEDGKEKPEDVRHGNEKERKMEERRKRKGRRKRKKKESMRKGEERGRVVMGQEESYISKGKEGQKVRNRMKLKTRWMKLKL